MVIIGAADEKDVYIGSDSLFSGQLVPGLFVYRRNGYVIGISSSPSIIYHIRTSFIPPKRNDKTTLEIHMATSFFSTIMSCLLLYKNQHVEMLIGSMSSLFSFSYDGIVECIDKYYAIGNGSDVALGSLYASMDMQAYKRIALALSAATKHTNAVRPPYTILSTGLYAVSRYNPDFHSNMTEVDISAAR